MPKTIEAWTELYKFINFINLNDDEKLIVFGWRNNESVRKWMYSDDPISLDTHFKFIESLKSDESRSFFLVKRGNKYVGVYSLVNKKNHSGEGGFYLSPDLKDENLSVEFCYYTFSFLFEKQRIEKIFGYALVDNKNANALNRLFGFSQLETNKTIDGVEKSYYYGELDRESWYNKVISNSRIIKLVEYSLNAFQ
jgi:UDP-4-amino-4,6-dideoxy-N-acetyl-beta-L-altrosamine N-acetyltransferase